MRKRNCFSVLFLLTVCAFASLAGQPASADVPPPEHLTAAQYLQSLAPQTSGPGLVVGEPVPVNCDASTADFGAACSFWLQIYVGGRGAFGQTPTWSEIHDSTIQILHRSNRRYASVDVPKVARSLGATDVATAQIVRKGDGYTLSYRLFTPAGKPAGVPLTVEGSESSILAALPDLAQKMSAAVGVPKTKGVPTGIFATPSDMASVGACLRDYQAKPSDAQMDHLRAIASRSPLAGLLLLDRGDYDAAVVDPLTARAAGNTLMLAEMRIDLWGSPRTIDSVVADALKTYPHNYALHAAEMNIAFFSSDWAGQRSQAEDSVRSAPRNPQAWTGLAGTINQQTDNVRHGRFIFQLSDKETAYVSSLYPLEEAVDKRAITLDPEDANAEESLSTAAAFNGDMNTAHSAFWKAMALDPNDSRTYEWGMTIYQSQWGGDPNTLRKVIRLVAARPDIFHSLYPVVFSAIHTLPTDSFRDQMEAKVFEAYIRQLPSDDPTGKIAAAIKKAQAQPTFENWSDAAGVMIAQESTLRAEEPLTEAEMGWMEDCADGASYAEEQALDKNPKDGDAWGRLSEYWEYAFGAAMQTPALERAFRYDPTDFDTFAWALQASEPSLGGDSSSVLDVVNRAAANPDLFERLSPFILDALNSVSPSDLTPDQADSVKKLTAQAQDAFTKLVAANPQDSKVQHELAMYYGLHVHYDQSNAAFEAWIRLSPKKSSPLSLYGFMLERRGDNTDALAQFQKALAIDPDDPLSLNWSGTILVGNGQYAQAQPLLERLVRVQPLHAAAYYELGMALYKQGKVAEARADWRRTVAMDRRLSQHGFDAQNMLDSTASATP